MSMITRLQEEKATLQMEALQYFRMMEKQPEYDTDELEKVNGLLIEKEKEIQDLEVELEFYRSNMADDEPMVHNMRVYPMKALKIVLPARITPLRCHGKLEFALLLKLLLLLLSCCGVLHTWLHKATKNPMYLNCIKVNGQTLGAANYNNTFG
ncbi:hypothetical protein JHK85_007058 [Glycine max]|nr:hypothetical protein JHK85_007058 [Glycine max]KAG5071647.1 hypothetical protein JHK86_006858 [Glycine max]